MMKKILTFAMALCMAPLCALAEDAPAYDSFQPLKELTQQHSFLLGAPLSFNQMNDTKYLDLVKYHFGSVTTTNEMKAYSLLSQMMCKISRDGMPQMNYYYADKMVQWAQDNGLKVRGHVLVWDAYMNDWFFREGYQNNTPYVDQETMRLRLESYITQVVTHFETKFPGVVYCWDVVNEAVGDNAGEYVAGDPRHLSTIRSGVSNLFRDHVGEDYVELSFLYARNAAEALGADIKLYYNDYNAFFEEKSNAICALVESINSYATNEDGSPRKLIDGVGMQGYIGGYGVQEGCLRESDLERIRTAIGKYAALDCDVQITEMALRNFDLTQADKHAELYGKLFKVFMEVNAGEEKPLTGVAIWGLTDHPNIPRDNYTYRMNSPYAGLITETYAIKPSFESVYKALTE